MSNFIDPTHRINPRVRAYGKARLDIARRAQTRQDWDALWKKPQHDFPFTWGSYWKQCIEYRVEDYAAEVGFFIDVLGLPVNAFNEYSAMFTGPAQEFYFAVTPTFEGQEPTSPDAFRMQFFLADIYEVVQELERRGITFELPPQPVSEGSNYIVGYFRTPHGICIDLCGLEDQSETDTIQSQPQLSEDREIESISSDQPNPVRNQEVYVPLGNDAEDVFVEVVDRPSPGSEPTYEPIEEDAAAAPAQTTSKPRTYRAIPFFDRRS